jgi:fructose 1,6-bisphosphate aldolase/phosphatase
VAGTEVAKEQGLYGAGQDILKDAFSGNVKGMGPAVAEMEFEERPN